MTVQSGNAATLLPRDNWSLVYFSSQHPGYEAKYAFDGDPNTLWHTNYDNPIPHPHEIQISLGGLYSISGFRYLPRQDDTNARISQYAFYVSTDGTNWGTPVATGTFPDSAAEQQVLFTPTPAAFIRLVALSANDGSDLSTVGELNVLGDPGSVGNQAPIGSIASPTADRVINIGDTLDFTATATDPDGNLPLSYQWSFGVGSGVPDSPDKDPGLRQFNNAGTFTVTFTVTDANGLSDPTPAVRLVTVQSGEPPVLLPQDNWSLVYTDSEEQLASDGAATNAFDGDPNTIWHSRWFWNVTPHPHEIQINLAGSYQISGFRYLPRQDSYHGRIKDYKFYASTDGINWGTPVATGTFPYSTAEQEVLFQPVQAVFVRMVALSEFNGGDLTTIAELNVLGNLSSGNQAPNSLIDTPASNITINLGDMLDITGTGTDPDGNLPLTYLWNFGAGSGIPDSPLEDPRLVQFNNAGVFTISFTTTDLLGFSDFTPATRTVEVCTPPAVKLLQPLSMHIQSSPDLYVSAHPCLDDGIHIGWGVRFTVSEDGGTVVRQFDDYTAPFEKTFKGLNKMEYVVDVTIIDDTGTEVGGLNTSDQATQVGIGDYYIGLGDSITLGFGDDVSFDNTSMDGRILLGGYEPILNDQLTASKGYPHAIFNEGVAGATTFDGLSQLPSLLAKHPQAQFFLIQYGTNDAGVPLPDGYGLLEGQDGYNGSFKDNMQQMITLITGAGKQAILAKSTYVLGDFSGRNALIQKYNQVIDELRDKNGISVLAPDFYSFFEANQTQYADAVHPNGTGYQSMANMWFNVLSP